MPIEVQLPAGFGSLTAAIHARLAEVVHETAEEVTAELKHKITEGSKTGRIYLSGPAPLPHQASAPGESPANWTGKLVESIHHEPTGPLSEDIKVDDPIAPLLEHGGVKMAARPFFYQTIEDAKPLFLAKVEAALKAL